MERKIEMGHLDLKRGLDFLGGPSSGADDGAIFRVPGGGGVLQVGDVCVVVPTAPVRSRECTSEIGQGAVELLHSSVYGFVCEMTKATLP